MPSTLWPVPVFLGDSFTVFPPPPLPVPEEEEGGSFLLARSWGEPWMEEGEGEGCCCCLMAACKLSSCILPAPAPAPAPAGVPTACILFMPLSTLPLGEIVKAALLPRRCCK